MGVRQLETYMKNIVHKGFVKISLVKACKAFKDQNNQLPVLVFDFLGFITVLTANDEETLCGGRFNKYREKFEEIIEELSKHAKLVFFEDGPIVEQKLSTWIKRHSDKYDDCIKIMKKVYDGQSLKDIIESNSGFHDIPRVTTLTEMMEQVVRQYGELIITFTRECDSEIARYAYNNKNVLAIVADDSDFLIYPGHWRYFSLRNINYSTLETFEYHRPSLRSFLNLNDEQLIILSTLNGNDIIKYDDARDNFHATFNPGPGFKHKSAEFRFPILAEYARKISPLPREKMIKKVSKLLNYATTQKVEESFEMYNPVFDIAEETDDLFQFCRDNCFNFTYAVLLRSPINFTCAYFDLSICDTYDAKVQIFEKQIGIILSNMPKKEFNRYEIITKHKHHEDYRSQLVTPRQLNDLPPLIELMDRSSYKHHDSIRFKLLKWMVSNIPMQLKNYNLSTFPTNYLQDILTLVVLRNFKFIDKFEADLIILSIKHVESNTIPEDLVVPQVLNEKAFRTAYLFSKFHMFLDRCFQVTGLINAGKLINFDGVLFHSLYLKYLDYKFDILEMLGELRPYCIYK